VPDTALETVNLEIAEGVATIELNRPEALNAWNFQLGEDLRGALETVAGDDEVRAVLLTGAGRAFSSGADLSETREGTSDSVDDEGNFDLSKRLRERYHPIIHAIRDMPKPVVSAVNGPAAGIGCSLALSADLIVAAHSSFFLLAFVNIGLVPDGGSTAFVPARIGLARATEMMMLGERVVAEQALEWGLVNKVVPDESLMSESRALVERLAKGPTRSYAGAKELLNRRVYADLSGQLEAEADQQRAMGHSKDFIEGVMAFAQKREPEFKGH
jgi:2-(1,2-epoxy-1,2-dihydrophenyl)acetyl-CoA isomerase